MELFVDNLTVIDCSYLHPIHLVEGESWICDVSLRGELDSQSMVMDFALVKKIIKQAIDRMADHALIVPTLSPNLKSISNHNGIVTLTWEGEDGQELVHESPQQAVWLLPAKAVTPEAVAAHLAESIKPLIARSIGVIAFHLHHEVIEGPYYHYSHGLKKHDGNCQRIAHGHRSKIEIWKNAVRTDELMLDWANKWKHIYIGSAEDISSEFDRDGVPYYQFAYQANQGQFALSLPKSRCDIIPSDSTVECIAEYIATLLKESDPKATFRVKAYEGVSKGAIVNK